MSSQSITDFSKEQVAKMAQDSTDRTQAIMQNAKAGVAQRGDVDAYNRWKKAAALIHGSRYGQKQESPKPGRRPTARSPSKAFGGKYKPKQGGGGAWIQIGT